MFFFPFSSPRQLYRPTVRPAVGTLDYVVGWRRRLCHDVSAFVGEYVCGYVNTIKTRKPLIGMT